MTDHLPVGVIARYARQALRALPGPTVRVPRTARRRPFAAPSDEVRPSWYTTYQTSNEYYKGYNENKITNKLTKIKLQINYKGYIEINYKE